MAARPAARWRASGDAMSSPTRRWCSVECFSSRRSVSSAAATDLSSAEPERRSAKMRASAGGSEVRRPSETVVLSMWGGRLSPRARALARASAVCAPRHAEWEGPGAEMGSARRPLWLFAVRRPAGPPARSARLLVRCFPQGPPRVERRARFTH